MRSKLQKNFSSHSKGAAEHSLLPLYTNNPRACFVFIFLFRHMKNNGRREDRKFSRRSFFFFLHGKCLKAVEWCQQWPNVSTLIINKMLCCSHFDIALILFVRLDAACNDPTDSLCTRPNTHTHTIIINNDTKNKAINFRWLKSVLGVV